MKYILFFIAMLTGSVLHAQVLINYQPAINGQTLDGLSLAQIVNTGVQVTGSLKITVKDGSTAGVVSIIVPALTIRPGVNALNKGVMRSASIRFGESPAAALLSQSGRFPEGEYEYCFEVSVPDVKPSLPPVIYENCFQQTLQPSTPLLLIDPYNGAEICNVRPAFSWQPPMPFVNSMRYRLVVVPKGNDETPEAAIANNRPVINKGDFRQQHINYPTTSPDLVKGQEYAWQVSVYSGSVLISSSEIWTFRIQCDDKLDTLQGGSFRELTAEGNKNFYIVTDGIVRFAFTNYYNDSQLQYEIVDLANPENSVKKLPRVQMHAGHNKAEIKPAGLISGKQYLLKIKNADKQELIMRFIYQDH